MRDPLTTPWVINTREIDAIVQTLRRGHCCRFIGPRYHRKSVMMRRACKRVDEQLGYVALYTSLRDTRTVTEEAFYTSLCDLMARRASRYYRLSLPRHTVRKAADLQRLLALLPTRWRNHVVLFVDDLELEVIPPDYIGELLRVLRGAFEDSRDWHFLAVVCASHNLAWAALGPTSPFFNISDLVLLSDLSPAETAQWARQQLRTLHAPPPTARAIDYLYEQTAGDRWLLNEICHEICREFDALRYRHVTVPLVKTAIENWLRRGGHTVWMDGIHELESDPQLLNALLILMKHSELPAHRIPLDLSREPDPLLTSGFVSRQGNRYQIKSDLHYRILERTLTPERVGQFFLAAGDYERALAYLRGNTRAVNETEERSQVMLSFINAMYTTSTKDDAFQQLAQGLHTAYPQQIFHLYDFDPKRQNLVLVHTSDTAPLRIACSARQRPEVKALSTPAEYYWVPSVDQRRTLFVPLRVNGENLGLVVVENLLTRRNFQRRQGQVRELLTYLHYAARALKNRADFEYLHRQTEQRARALEYLLKLTRELMQTHAPFKQVLQQTLHIALKALRGRAQMGSVYLYDPQTDELTMAMDTGYAPQVREIARFHPGDGLVGYVYATGRPYIVHDTTNDPHYRALPGLDVDICSAMGIPLPARQRPLGVLCVDNLRQTRAFDDESKRLMMVFANHVGLWLERVRLTDILQRQRDTAQLAADLIHQFKGAIASIPEVTEEIQAEIHSELQPRLAQLVSELYDKSTTMVEVSKWLRRFIEVGSIQLREEDLVALLAQVYERTKKVCPAHIQIHILPSHVSKLWARVDRTLVEILLDNLIENAFEAIPSTQAGQVTLRIEQDGHLGVIHVWNDGPPIPPEYHDKIWKPDFSTKGDSRLRGLGLALCQCIARAHDGTLTHNSDSTGVTFTFRLPLYGPEV